MRPSAGFTSSAEAGLKIQRQKTVKTAEALMRAFDDLELMHAKGEVHKKAIALCKWMVVTAKEWN